ncbi:MAG: glutamine-hydrolyzing GMP synthase, partial [Spirochaetia bacterium]|nr:glutamine-hydrolyzing GMP synthase [Spirochaetia bacterium]
MEKKEHDTIVVLDFGAQYSQLIARRVREQHVYSYIVPYTTSAQKIKELAPKGIIFSGGPMSVSVAGSPRPDKEIFSLGIPILGICYGLQVMSVMNGGSVERPEKREYGFAHLNIVETHSSLLKGVDNNSVVWMSHGDSVKTLFDGATCTSSTENCEFAVVEDEKNQMYGVQFHPEVVHTPIGTTLLKNFVVDICKANQDWSMESFIETEVNRIRETVGDKQVLCGLSGGVDSSVVAALLHKAIGDQLICVFVNNGLLRKGEADLVISVFKEHFNIRLQYAESEKLFLDAR